MRCESYTPRFNVQKRCFRSGEDVQNVDKTDLIGRVCSCSVAYIVRSNKFVFLQIRRGEEQRQNEQQVMVVLVLSVDLRLSAQPNNIYRDSLT